MTSTLLTPQSSTERATVPCTMEPTHLVVNVSGRLTVLNTVDALTAFNRRTETGTTYRVELGEGLAAWLDGDFHPGGDINWVATHMATNFGQPYVCPWDAPFLCGPVIFTGIHPGIGLTEQHLALLVDVHAAAEQWAP